MEADGTRTWTKSDGERTFTLVVEADGTSTATRQTEKTTQKLKDGCAMAIDEKTIRRLLKEVEMAVVKHRPEDYCTRAKLGAGRRSPEKSR
ncbi:hypothetical protein [Caballeronia sordidicola]|uniref:hypothetical protein n=1 Tax=Caballeronia sordidicola TaxID=196367 RepID=UPI000A48CF77|nr:hypothetical protein [Caballeronia sordidicola]